MNVFDIQQDLVRDYKSYVESFVKIRDEDIRKFVEHEYENDKYWPEALVQLNPAFQTGSTVEDLTESSVLHPGCAGIFRFEDQSMRLHLHQEEAVHKASTGRSYVLTTGTGSGKSLSYFIPIIDRVLRRGPGKGLKAIVVYPMNALCNSQLEELRKFLGDSATSPISYRRYTGQESDEERQEIRANPPDILLTNYVMLELILTRNEDARLLERAKSLEFLVLDELHTYRGRQGADVALLTRRVKDRTGATNLQYVGTSATMATEGARAERLKKVAEVASTLFGADITADEVIDETLSPIFADDTSDPKELEASIVAAAAGQLPANPEEFFRNPLAAWIERSFGAASKDGRVERVTPITITDGASKLSEMTGQDQSVCIPAIRSLLMRGYDLKHPGTGRPLFAFRLHQFISRGDTVFSTLDRGPARRMTLDGQTTLPTDKERRLYPLAFCRSCGEDYFVVDIPQTVGPDRLVPRNFRDMARQDDADRSSGYIWLDSNLDASSEKEPFTFVPDRVPDQYLVPRKGDEVSISSDLRKRLQAAEVDQDGAVRLFDPEGISEAWFIRGRLPFCLQCGETWDQGVGEFTKLGTLASEGRAGATTLISLKLVQALRRSEGLDDKAKKLLSFTDNRQDASLQAGHFNDFVMTSMLRAGILASLPGEGHITYDRLPDSILENLNLDHKEYALEGVDGRMGKRRARDAFRDILSYRMFRDLRRGWRVNQPNLEQLGLLAIDYEEVDEIANDPDFWSQELRSAIDKLRSSSKAATIAEWTLSQDLNDILEDIIKLPPDTKSEFLKRFLEHFRREGAIQARVLQEGELISLRDRAVNNLNDLWGVDEFETLEPARPLKVAQRQRRGSEKAVDITPLSKVGREIADPRHWGLPAVSKRMSTSRRLLVLQILAQALLTSGHLVDEGGEGYLLAADTLQWRRAPNEGVKDPNRFFRDFYLTLADALPFPGSADNFQGMRAAEHTAQVTSEKRGEREEEFRNGTLPVMYSSPTMELGVDISSLNAVNMRNVPPTPANYAQRSGRAGRVNQPAIVVTYCAAFSPHDQYYFNRRAEMVAGVVSPPRIDLLNRDLISSHMHSVWLAETGVRLPSSLGDVLEHRGENKSLEVREDIARQLADEGARRRATQRCQSILDNLGVDLKSTRWYRDGWLESLLTRAPHSFNAASDRWRSLYRSATEQLKVQHERRMSQALSDSELRRARVAYDEAERQRQLLTGDQKFGNDFYSYRYLASEGFLPGYNFPRLPLTAYIPGRRGGSNDGEYLQRSRFIAISEYGPGNSIYYEGSRYRVERITLPTSSEPDSSITETLKVCRNCGYAHNGSMVNADICANPSCGAVLDGAFHQDNLIRLESVVTRRVERISSEEEERQRQGFDLMTAIQFGETAQGPDYERGELKVGNDGSEAELIYASSAKIWQINLGWRRRRNKESHGFHLDMNRGVWGRRENPLNDKGAESPEFKEGDSRIVVPYVDDHRNAFLIRLGKRGIGRLKGDNSSPSTSHYLTLGHALKRGICVAFQLEENELSMDLLPNNSSPHSILFVESSEGGAGVLTRLLEEPGALGRVARAALETLHFDPESGEDLGLKSNCGTACYQCLLSYTNQTEHDLLNRFLVRETLMAWQNSQVTERSAEMTREQLRDELKKLTQSTLENGFVDWLYENGYRLPDKTQKLIEDPYARPDFWYESGRVCVYVDGPHHEHEGAKERDSDARRILERRGYQVVVVTYPDRWRDEVSQWSDVFGEGASSK